MPFNSINPIFLESIPESLVKNNLLCTHKFYKSLFTNSKFTNSKLTKSKFINSQNQNSQNQNSLIQNSLIQNLKSHSSNSYFFHLGPMKVKIK